MEQDRLHRRLHKHGTKEFGGCEIGSLDGVEREWGKGSVVCGYGDGGEDGCMLIVDRLIDQEKALLRLRHDFPARG